MSVFTILLISFPILIVGMHIVKAETNNEYIQFSAFKLFSPLNKTYNSGFLTLNLTFGAARGIKYSLNYSIDEKYEGSIPFVINNPNETHVFYEANGFVELPQLSEGSHSLTFNFVSGLYNYHGVNPPSAPFKQTSSGSSDYVASWTDTIYFTTSTAEDSWTTFEPMPTPRIASATASPDAIPQLPMWIILALFPITALVVVGIKKKAFRPT